MKREGLVINKNAAKATIILVVTVSLLFSLVTKTVMPFALFARAFHMSVLDGIGVTFMLLLLTFFMYAIFVGLEE